jgi:DNA-binding beta-propeller fold protein YncE
VLRDDAEVSFGNAGRSPLAAKEVGVPGALRTAFAVAVLGSGLVAGCSGAAPQDQQGVPPAGPASAPRGGAAPAGSVTPLGAPATAVVVDPRTRTVATALTGPPRLVLTTLDSTAPPRQIPLPGAATDLVLAAEGGPLLVPVSSPGSLVRVPLDGAAPSRVDLDGAARGAAVVGGRTVVSLGDRLTVLEGDRPVRTIPDFADATRLVPAGSKVGVLDAGRSAMTLVDPASGEVGATVQVGNGAVDAVTDRYGRILVTDVRDSEFLALAGDPLLLRQRYPLAGAPYGLAYDPRRDLAWVTLTARNEVVGLGVAGGEPVVVHRYPTVHQPDSVAVDPVTGRVLVASASGVGLQLIDPERVVQ